MRTQLSLPQFKSHKPATPADHSTLLIAPEGTSMTACEHFEVALRTGTGTYPLLREVSAGDNWTVYESTSERFSTNLALKTIRPRAENGARAAKRFQRYAIAAVALSHANLTSVYDAGITEDGEWYVLTDWQNQKTLKDILDCEGFLDPAFAIDIFIQAAEALAYAHSNNVLHLNLKPQKVFIRQTSIDSAVIKISDCGLAQIPAILAEETPLLEKKSFGEPHYTSPEACLGQRMDERSDIYSLGCMMYEALMGCPPFNGTAANEVMLKHIRECPPPFAKAMSDHTASPELEAIIMRCLKRDPLERYQKMVDLLQDLQCVELGQQPINLKMSPRILNSAKVSKRSSHMATAAWLLLSLSVLATISGIILEVTTNTGHAVASRTEYAE